MKPVQNCIGFILCTFREVISDPEITFHRVQNYNASLKAYVLVYEVSLADQLIRDRLKTYMYVHVQYLYKRRLLSLRQGG